MKRWSRRLGTWAQGLILGFLFFLAIAELLSKMSGTALFVYQGF